MRQYFFLGATLLSFLLASCSETGKQTNTETSAPVQTSAISAHSVETEFGVTSCKQEPDMNDPNETPYLRCPGVAGYSLIVRRVDSGRKSIDVIDRRQQSHPLNYQDVISRQMFALGGKAEWRIVGSGEQQTPVALIVSVKTHENIDDPEKVTNTYLAVAKITQEDVCVTDRIVDGSLSAEQLRQIADEAPKKPCLPPQPPLPGDTNTAQ